MLSDPTGKRFHDLLDFHLDDSRFTFWNILPPASPERFAAIKDSIATGTWTGRIVLDELGRILYGHDDYRAFRQLSKPARHIIHVKVGDRCTRAEVEGLIRLWRYCDGGLATRDERLEAVRHQLRITPYWSNREIARLLHDNKDAVGKERTCLEETGEISQFLFPGGRGKTKGLPMVLARDRKEAKKNAPLLDVKNLNGQVYSPRVLRQKKADKERDAMADRAKDAAVPDNIHLFPCDFRDLDAPLHRLDIRPGGVDLIWTDPPWNALSLGLYPDLARLAREWLKPGGILGVYPGTVFENEANDVLRRELHGFKTIGKLIVVNTAAGQGRIVRYFQSAYQPILLFSKGDPALTKVGYSDLCRAKREPRLYHDWQRTESETLHWLSILAEPGQMVVDPFGGGFTTAACCLKLGLNCVSCDIDQRAYDIGKNRVADTWEEMQAAKSK